jgi:SAM-dependent methyltransferase
VSQVTSGARRILDVPRIYDLLQDLMGGSLQRSTWTAEYLKPFRGARILDIGCGTGNMLRHLPDDLDYTGFDASQSYINAAASRYGNRGRFVCANVGAADVEVGTYDLAIGYGVLHHLDDDGAREVFRGAHRALKPTGRLVTLDPAFVPGQGFVSRFLASHDRGRNVRIPEAYAELGKESFSRVEICSMPKTLRIHIDDAVLVCRK